MYARTIKITFKDSMSKDMFVNYTDTKADEQGIGNGTLMKFIMSNSDIAAPFILIFPDYDTFKKDDQKLAGPIIQSMRNQDLKVELHQGEIVGATAVSTKFFKILEKEANFYASKG